MKGMEAILLGCIFNKESIRSTAVLLYYKLWSSECLFIWIVTGTLAGALFLWDVTMAFVQIYFISKEIEIITIIDEVPFSFLSLYQCFRTKLHEEFSKQIIAVFNQWDADMGKSKEQEEKLMVGFWEIDKFYWISVTFLPTQP